MNRRSKCPIGCEKSRKSRSKSNTRTNTRRSRRSKSNTNSNSECRRHNPCKFGSYREVYHGSAVETPNGLKQKDIIQNRWGRLVSKKKHELGKKLYSQKKIKKIFDNNRAREWKKGKSGLKKSSKKHRYRIGSETR
jgi:hypothetical protein